MNTIKIRRGTVADEALIVESWKKAYKQDFNYKYPTRWNWMSKGNPFYRWSSQELSVWVCELKDKIIAWNGSMDIIIELNNKPYPAAFSVDTFTLPQYRGKNFALS